MSGERDAIRDALYMPYPVDVDKLAVTEWVESRERARRALVVLAERVAVLEEALRPFADPRNWHHNYDGSGVIFYMPRSRNTDGAIDNARTALAGPVTKEKRKAKGGIAPLRGNQRRGQP